jgi:hypothetical protein
MIVVSHQPDLLPYSGFWFKMHQADLFDLKVFDQFQARGYQRRVKMRGSWASIPVVGSPSRVPITHARIRPDEARVVLADHVAGRYRSARHWDDVGPALLDLIDRTRTTHLWQFNLELILGVRAMLGITTPLSIALPPEARGSRGLVGVLRQYGADTYLAGQGGRAYMGDCEEFRSAGIEVVWSAHSPVTGDSIVTVLMDYDDPMDVVLRTHARDEKTA